MNRGFNVTVVTILSFATMALGGCASASGGTRAATGTLCAAVAADSVFAAGLPVYRPCGVDVPAKLISRSNVDYRPSSPRAGCWSAEIEFVVDAKGVPETSTARIIGRNDQGYADALVNSLSGWKYEPARLGGVPVREIVSEKGEMAAIVRVQVGNAPPTRSSQRPPSC